MRNFEDNFVERKTVCRSFANSAPIGMPSVLYLGARDDGTFEEKTIDFDDLQRKINRMLQCTYPRVPYIAKVITAGTKQVLAVIVPGSALRPHFAGPHTFVQARNRLRHRRSNSTS